MSLIKSTILDQTFKGTRRQLLKAMGIATAGGVSSLILSQGLNAASGSDNAAAEKISLPPSSDTDDGLYWNDVRSKFVLRPDIIYLNTGTEGSMPASVLASLTKNLKEFAGSPMECIGFKEDTHQMQIKNRKIFSEFAGADFSEIVLTTNTTEGLHFAVNGLDLKKGDEIITTLHDHHSGLSALHILKDRKGITIKELALPVPADSKQEIIDIFERAITAKTKVISICNINYTTGLRMPVKELCDMARHRGIISIVDGAHAMGALDFNLHDLGCDFYACSGHKWLNGPPGTGIFYIRNAGNNPHSLWPVLTEVYYLSNKGRVSTMLQMRGQQNTPALAAMIQAVELQKTIGRNKVQERILSLNRYLKERIIETWGKENLMTSFEQNDLCSGLTSFTPFKVFKDRYDSKKNLEVCKQLRKQNNIYIRNVDFKLKKTDTTKTNALRISTHIFNSCDEIDTTVRAIKKIADKI